MIIFDVSLILFHSLTKTCKQNPSSIIKTQNTYNLLSSDPLSGEKRNKKKLNKNFKYILCWYIKQWADMKTLSITKAVT
jgi:hypothetical protein